MLKESQRVDKMFQLIKRITPVIVVLYMLFCWFIIHRSSHDSLRPKPNFSIVINGSLAVQDETMALKPKQ